MAQLAKQKTLYWLQNVIGINSFVLENMLGNSVWVSAGSLFRCCLHEAVACLNYYRKKSFMTCFVVLSTYSFATTITDLLEQICLIIKVLVKEKIFILNFNVHGSYTYA